MPRKFFYFKIRRLSRVFCIVNCFASPYSRVLNVEIIFVFVTLVPLKFFDKLSVLTCVIDQNV